MTIIKKYITQKTNFYFKKKFIQYFTMSYNRAISYGFWCSAWNWLPNNRRDSWIGDFTNVLSLQRYSTLRFCFRWNIKRKGLEEHTLKDLGLFYSRRYRCAKGDKLRLIPRTRHLKATVFQPDIYLLVKETWNYRRTFSVGTILCKMGWKMRHIFNEKNTKH